MSLLSTSITNLFNGVSQQPAELRDPSQAAVQMNAVSSPAYGLRKRPGTTHVAKIGAEASNPVVHFINRDRDEQYAVVASNGAIEVYDAQTGAKVQVTTPDGVDYLKCGNPQDDLRLVTVADYTFVVNTKRPVQLSASLVDSKDQLAGTISFPIPLIRPPVLDPTDPTKTPGAGGTVTNPSLPNYGGYPSTGGGGGGWPGSTPPKTDPTKPPTTTPDKPKDPSNPPPTTTDPGTGTGTDPGTGGGTGGTGGTGGPGGTIPPTDPVTPPAPPPVTSVAPNADGTWPDLDPANHSYRLPDDKTLMPAAVGDYLELINVLKARGFWDNMDQLLVTYRPQISMKVKAGCIGGEVLKGCFTTDYHFSEPARIYAMVSAYLAQGGKYAAIPYYYRASPYYDGVNQSFPQLTWPTSKDYFGIYDEIAGTPGAAFRTYSGSQSAGIVVRDPLSFDACYVFLLEETETGQRHCEAISVRVSVMGFPGGENTPGTSGALSLLAGDANRNYTAGGYRWNSAAQAFNIPFLGFTNEFNRLVGSRQYGWYGGISSLTGLTIDTYRGNGIPYAYGPGGQWTEGPKDLTFPGFPLKFEPPRAFKLIARAAATWDQLGDYAELYEPMGFGQLAPAKATVYPT